MLALKYVPDLYVVQRRKTRTDPERKVDYMKPVSNIPGRPCFPALVWRGVGKHAARARPRWMHRDIGDQTCATGCGCNSFILKKLSYVVIS